VNFELSPAITKTGVDGETRDMVGGEFADTLVVSIGRAESIIKPAKMPMKTVLKDLGPEASGLIVGLTLSNYRSGGFLVAARFPPLYVPVNLGPNPTPAP